MEKTSTTTPTRRARLGRHLRRQAVAYLALIIAVAVSPLPAWAAGKIGPKRIKNGAITNVKIADNAVTSNKILDGNVTPADLAANARGFTNVIVRSKSGPAVNGGAKTTITVNCSAGEVAIGGGAYLTDDDGFFIGDRSYGQIVRSGPVHDGAFGFSYPDGAGATPTMWRTTVEDTEAPGDSDPSTGWVLCALK
ncbi:MAG TPA: hypothetical protein PKX56_04785 [Marmoricola sp.]|nr:hypothetical protein [Marmoricola sp.]HNI71089.1 hypothetical protein [Marmoricola sp.]HNJ78650.1 hypothetical protein [Marmoricola sp.]HNN47346.1 hypothetical protein [Marmoricola sp.]